MPSGAAAGAHARAHRPAPAPAPAAAPRRSPAWQGDAHISPATCPFKAAAGAARTLAAIHWRAAAAAWAESATAVEAVVTVAGPVVLDAAHVAAAAAVSAWEVGVPVARAAWAATTTTAARALATAVKTVALTILEPPGSVSFELNAIRSRWPAGGEHAGTPVGQFVERLIAEQLAARTVRRAVVKEVAALTGVAGVGVALFTFTHALEKKRVWAWRLDGAVRRRLRLRPVRHAHVHRLLATDNAGLGLVCGKLVGAALLAFVAVWCSTGLLALAPPPPPQVACMMRRRV